MPEVAGGCIYERGSDRILEPGWVWWEGEVMSYDDMMGWCGWGVVVGGEAGVYPAGC